MSEIVPLSQTEIRLRSNTKDLMDGLAVFLRLNVADGDASEHTIRSYLSHIQQYANWAWSQAVDPGTATEEQVRLYRRHLVTSGAKRTTIAVKLCAVRRFYAAAVWHGLRTDNPAEGLKPPRDRTSQQDRILRRYITPAEVDNLLSLPHPDRRQGARDLAMMGLMYYHGLRVGTVATLQVGDLLLEQEQPSLNIRHAKGRKARTLLLIPSSLTMISQWLHLRAEVVHERSENTLFVSLGSRLGYPLTAQGIRFVINGWLTRAGIRTKARQLSCHALRHAHATHALDRGADLTALSREMGHASINTTGVYLHVVDAMRKNPASVLERKELVTD